ncbi:unnamed protein product [Chrysoparadoxa australica]
MAATSLRPVCVVGGGPVGLTLCSLLARYGVPSLLLEKRDGLTNHPAGHYLSHRTMEVFRHSFRGLYNRIHKRSPPLDEWRDHVYCYSATGRVLARTDSFAGACSPDRLAAITAASAANVPQTKLLPLIMNELFSAEAKATSELVFDASLAGFREHADGVELKVELTGEDGKREIQTTDCSFLIGCDGASSRVREALGIACHGKTGLGGVSVLNIYFCSKGLRSRLKGRPGMLRFIYNEDVVAILSTYSVEEGDYSCHVVVPNGLVDADALSEEQPLGYLRSSLGLSSADEMDLSIRSVKQWTLDSLVAEEFSSQGRASAGSSGRVMLAGDAAHHFPPAAGIGMNVGIQDVHNLAWKLALVHQGGASADLLSTYQQERLPHARRSAALSVHNYKRSLRPAKALGLGVDLAETVLSKTGPLKPAIVRLGSMHLRSLRCAGHPVGDALVRSLTGVLRDGAGVPSVQPVHDLALAYTGEGEASGAAYSSEALWGRQLLRGGRMPHFSLSCMSSDGRALQFTTTDIGAQIGTALGRPTFVLVAMATGSKDWLRWLESEGLAELVALVTVKEELAENADREAAEDGTLQPEHLGLSSGPVVWVDARGGAASGLLSSMQHAEASGVLVRPDGVVAALEGADGTSDSSDTSESMGGSLRTALQGMGIPCPR